MIKSLIFFCVGGISLLKAAELGNNTKDQIITCENFSLPTPYQMYLRDGISHNLDSLVLTISTFKKSDDGFYQFLNHDTYPILLTKEGAFSNNRTKDCVPISAIGLAFEICGSASNLGGPVQPRKRITALDHFVFDYGENVMVKELQLFMKMQGEHTLKVKLITRSINGYEAIIKTKGDVFDSESSWTTTQVSSSTADGYYNIFWQNYLNDKNKGDR